MNHYKKIGYDKVFIYDNNDIDDEKFEDVLNQQISNNFVKIINYRGYRGKKQHPQFEAFIDCYKKNKNALKSCVIKDIFFVNKTKQINL